MGKYLLNSIVVNNFFPCVETMYVKKHNKDEITRNKKCFIFIVYTLYIHPSSIKMANKFKYQYIAPKRVSDAIAFKRIHIIGTIPKRTILL